MTRIVLDASVALAWCYPEEASEYVRQVLRMLGDADAIVPSIWPLEIANALVVAEKRARLKDAESRRFLSLVRQMPVTIDVHTASTAWAETLSLARRHGLSVYDAAYLELAIREGLPLATLDGSLRKPARKSGVAVAGV